MPSKILLPTCIAVFLICMGCERPTDAPRPRPAAPPVAATPPVPVEVLGTVAEHALLVTGGNLAVDGYGLVAGLGKNGSSECPPAVEAYLVEYLKKNKIGSSIYGTRELTPQRIIRDLDTAVVLLRTEIPPGAWPGQRFDLTVSCAPQSQTRTLDGGVLMPAELQRSIGGMPLVGGGRASGKILGRAGGAVFINPFLDASKPTDLTKCRSGRIIGGAVALEARPIFLQLYQPDHGRLRRLQDRVKERFPVRDMEVARGVGNQMLELKVPPAYRDDVEHFTQLVMHLPLVSSGAQLDAHAQRVAKMMEGPTARHEDLALVLEAMGRQAEPILRGLYSSRNPLAQFYAARTGLRLGDAMATDVILRYVRGGDSKLRTAAIEELGRHKQVYRAATVLRELLDDDNNLVRLAAYEALRRRGDPAIETLTLDDEFKVDLVPSSKEDMIYARQTGEPRLAIFGKKVPVRCPMFFNAPDDLVTINAREGDKQLMMFRTVPRTGQISDRFACDFVVADMVATWGKPPERDVEQKVQGMGLTYGQAVSCLYRMCKEGGIPAKFVLQELPDVRKMSEGATGTGRPDLTD